jgi:hydrogenase maturation protease
MKILVIGYGNPLRGDDSVGYRLAEQVATWNWPHVQAIACHQLTPELAATMAECDVVIFVDAALPGTQAAVAVQALSVGQATPLETHFSHPAALLRLTQQLYDQQPEAHQILIPTAEMGFSESLSAIAQAGLVTALQHVQTLAQS